MNRYVYAILIPFYLCASEKLIVGEKLTYSASFKGIKAAKAKLLSNFLSLLTTTTVIEFFRSANQLDIDINLLCEVAKLGSGNSGALDRISSKALQ